jgi:phosphoesterase RecJ-like protein
MSINWSAFVDIINSHERFVLTSHIRPDCDALGSELGMAQILETLGKDVKIVNGHPTPPNLDFIDPTDRIYVIGDTISIDELRDREVLMILDTSAWAQLGPMGDVLKGLDCKKIVLDHHVSEDELGAEAFKNTTAEATGRLVVEAAEQLGVELTPEMSMPIFAALATDTGWFRFSSADGYTYRVGAHLIESGADPSAIYNSLYEQDTAGRVRLRGTILSRIAVELDGHFAHTYVRKIDFENTGALPSDTEDAINLSLAIAGVEFAIILVEQLTGGFKISFRSRCHLECSQIAEIFGGGGHKAAAGAFLEGEFEDVQAKVLDVVRDAMR